MEPRKVVQIGIDPGEKGAVVFLSPNGSIHAIQEMAKCTEVEMVRFVESNVKWFRPECEVRAELEQIIPRPTIFGGGASILRSTCILYGSYRAYRALLITLNVPYEEVIPQTWQKGLGLRPKVKGESDTSWKGYLKEVAQGKFPDRKVTLAIADALLIASYHRTTAELPENNSQIS